MAEGVPDGEATALATAFHNLEAAIAELDLEERKHFRDLMGEGVNRVWQALLQYRAAKYAEGLRHTNPN